MNTTLLTLLLCATVPVGDERLVVTTNHGDIVIAPLRDVATRTSSAIFGLARHGIYDGTHVHRVDRRFLIQVSDPHDRVTPLDASQSAMLRPLPIEADDRVRHVPGMVGLAHYDDEPDSGVASFYIVTSTAAHLDGSFTLFGRVVGGTMTTVQRILHADTNAQHRPHTRIPIYRAKVYADAAEAGARPARSADSKGPWAVVRTSYGDFVLRFFDEHAPKTVAQITRLMRLGAYDTTHVSFIDPRFALQVSDIRNRAIPIGWQELEAMDTLPLETSSLQHVRGMLSLSRPRDDPDGGESSFIIVTDRAPQLDGQYTIFGEVERNMEVVDALLTAPVDRNQRPRPKVTIDRIEIHDSATSLAQTELRDARAGPTGNWSNTEVNPAHAALLVVALALILLGSGRIPRVCTRLADAARMFAGLILAYDVVMVLTPAAHDAPWLGLALFVVTLAAIRWMGTFETPRPQKQVESAADRHQVGPVEHRQNQ